MLYFNALDCGVEVSSIVLSYLYLFSWLGLRIIANSAIFSCVRTWRSRFELWN